MQRISHFAQVNVFDRFLCVAMHTKSTLVYMEKIITRKG